MDEHLNKILQDFYKKAYEENNITTNDVISLLDEISDELHLQQIYVCENAGSKNHYLYPYVSSKGPKAMTMHQNLIVFPDSDIDNLYVMFKESPIQVIDNNISSKRNATAINNLIYGFLDKNICLGFISFQPYENEEKRIWSDEDKEVLSKLAYIIKPLITSRQVFDRYAYEENLKSSSSSVLWYYPTLSLIIVPEETMNRFMIPNFVYRDAPNSIVSELVNEGYQQEVNDAILSLKNGNSSVSVVFQGKISKNKYYRLNVTTNRYDDKNNPEEVMGLLEEINKEEYDHINTSEVYKKYQIFREAISRSNLVEYYVNLKTGKVTLFKSVETISDFFAQSDDFDTIVQNFADKCVSPSSKGAFTKILNRQYLYLNLNQYNKYITINSQIIIDGKEHIYETTIVLYNHTIYNYCNEVMVFVRDVTHLESLNYDNLTGLYSLNYFMNFLSNKKTELIETKEENIGYIVFYDILDFKYYNLGMGLNKGNEILKKFAVLLQKTYPGFIVSRYGDDRFVIYDNNNDNKVKDRINKVISSFENIDPNYSLKVKAGMYVPSLSIEPASWVDYAQLACQEIKYDINVNFQEFDEDLKNKLLKKNYIIDNIDKALENQWVKVYFQPVIGTKENKLVAMEALTRWIDPVYGFLSPNDFISVLEENNLIYKIDTFVINKVCERLSYELKLNHPIVPISINLSRVDFVTCQPFEEVEKAIKKYNIDRKYICIEITESIAMEDPKLLTKAINQFRNAGYEVWMDDFGSGYSSLNALKDYPFDEIKIDMAFLKNFNDKSKAIISSTIAMAKKINIRTLTEGVENKEHYDFLKDIGCERIQGYYFSKPLPYEEVIELMKSKNLL